MLYPSSVRNVWTERISKYLFHVCSNYVFEHSCSVWNTVDAQDVSYFIRECLKSVGTSGNMWNTWSCKLYFRRAWLSPWRNDSSSGSTVCFPPASSARTSSCCECSKTMTWRKTTWTGDLHYHLFFHEFLIICWNWISHTRNFPSGSLQNMTRLGSRSPHPQRFTFIS